MVTEKVGITLCFMFLWHYSQIQTRYQLPMDPSGVQFQSFYAILVHSIVLFKEPWSQNNSWTKWTSCNQHVISMLERNEKQQLMFVV